MKTYLNRSTSSVDLPENDLSDFSHSSLTLDTHPDPAMILQYSTPKKNWEDHNYSTPKKTEWNESKWNQLNGSPEKRNGDRLAPFQRNKSIDIENRRRLSEFNTKRLSVFSLTDFSKEKPIVLPTSPNLPKKQSFYRTPTNKSSESFQSTAKSLKRYDTATSGISTVSSKFLAFRHRLSRTNTTDSKRFSFSNTLKRISSNYLKKDMKTDMEVPKLPELPFWKYHVLKYGKDLYLTTNPDLKHMYCRNGPGYYVEIVYKDRSTRPDLSKGFTLTFKDINNIHQDNKKIPTLLSISKKSLSEGGHYTVSVPRISNDSSTFNGLLIKKEFQDRLVSINNESGFINYEFRDFNNIKWNIGSIPWLKTQDSQKNNTLSIKNYQNTKSSLVPILNKKKSKTFISAKSGNNRPDFTSGNSYNASSSSNSTNYQEQSFVGKKNIYFHQNYIDKHQKQNSLTSSHLDNNQSKEKFPSVLAVFRPYEVKLRKRLLQSFYRNKKQQINHVDPSQASSHKFSSNNLTNDLGAGSNIRNYYTVGDGLYYVLNPSDDCPDDNKLGWITIYEDLNIFGIENKGMFEIVLGLTLAVGLEKNNSR